MNYTVSNNTELTQWEQVLFTTSYAVSIAMSLLGNGLILDILRKNKPMRSGTNVMIVNQACADLLVTLVFMPGQMKVVFVKLAWFSGIWGLVSCKVFYASQYLCLVASIYSLLAITADRYFVVAHPLRRSPLARHLKKIILAIWLAAVASQGLTFFIVELSYDETTCMYNTWKVSTMVLAILSALIMLLAFIIPSVAIVTLFINICRRLWTRTIPGNTPSDRQRNQLKRTNIRITKMMFVVSSLLWLSWLPFKLCRFSQNQDIISKVSILPLAD